MRGWLIITDLESEWYRVKSIKLRNENKALQEAFASVKKKVKKMPDIHCSKGDDGL